MVVIRLRTRIPRNCPASDTESVSLHTILCITYDSYNVNSNISYGKNVDAARTGDTSNITTQSNHTGKPNYQSYWNLKYGNVCVSCGAENVHFYMSFLFFPAEYIYRVLVFVRFMLIAPFFSIISRFPLLVIQPNFSRCGLTYLSYNLSHVTIVMMITMMIIMMMMIMMLYQTQFRYNLVALVLQGDLGY